MPNAARSSDVPPTTAPDAGDTDVVILDGGPSADPTVGTDPAPTVPGTWGRLHGLAVALPLGAWGGAVLFDLVSASSNETMWPRAAMWLVIVGLVGAVAAAVLGMLDVAGASDAWTRSRALVNVRADVLVLVLVVASLVIRRSKLDEFLEGTPIVALVLSAVALALALALSWTGRTLVFRTSSVVPAPKVVVDLVAPSSDLPHVAVSAAKAKRGIAGGNDGAATTSGPDAEGSAAVTDPEADPAAD